jgi:thiol:disulfide interchange protein
MKLLPKLLVALCIGAAVAIALAWHQSRRPHAGYSPAADPSQQLDTALQQARAGGKRVLVIAGGDWCRWCLILDRFVKSHPDLQSALEQNFVVIKVYVGDKNPNKAFFAKLPKARGYPYFWVLHSDGSLVAATDTGPFEQGRDSYDKERLMGFITQMKPS